MSDLTDDKVRALLDGATPGRRVQFHGSYCPEAVGTPFTDWDTSHDVSVIRPDGSRYRLAHYKHASDAYLSQMAPDLARALLDARAEHAASLIRINAEAVEAVAQARADAQAAVALALEEAAENKEQLEIWAHEILVGLAFADVLKIDSYNDKIEAHDMVGRGLVEVIRALAPADALAEVQRLRVEARENAMQALASMGQAQEAYEAQLEAEAELAAAQQREAELLAALEDPLVVHLNMVAGKIAKPLPSQLAHIYGEDVIRAALAPTPTDPGDGWTWHERLGWIGPDGKPADPRRRG